MADEFKVCSPYGTTPIAGERLSIATQNANGIDPHCRHQPVGPEGKLLRPIVVVVIPQLSPLGWDHINLTGDYVWSDSLSLDAEGFMPLRQVAQ